MFDFLFKKKKELLSKMKFKQIVSYSTRPMRDYETNGVQHKFITSREAKNILIHNKSVAYTQIGECEYFVTEDQLIDPEANLYIIDPKGINYLFREARNLRDYVILYIKTSNKVRDRRAQSRPGYIEEVYRTRVEAENDQFYSFEIDKNILNIPYYIINNDSDDINKAMKQVNKVLLKTYSKNTMYLVVGRTCSGKDTICNKLIERNNNSNA